MGKGKLVFKGEKPKSKKKKKSHHSSKSSSSSQRIEKDVYIPISTEAQHHSAGRESQTRLSTKNTSTTPSSTQPVIHKGQGKITSSGTVLMGFNTKFNSCLNAGDAIIVKIPASNDQGSSSSSSSSSKDEMRVVTMRLSDTSASISSSFSQDLKHPTSFQYITKPKNLRKEREEKEKRKRLTESEIERSAFGTYKSGGNGQTQELVYRERTEHGSYRIRREEVSSNSTRSDLLEMRLQKKSDKFC